MAFRLVKNAKKAVKDPGLKRTYVNYSVPLKSLKFDGKSGTTVGVTNPLLTSQLASA